MPRSATVPGRPTVMACGWHWQVGLGLGPTRHGERAEGEVGRKGMSVERTFAAISATGDLQAKVPLYTRKCRSSVLVCWGPCRA